MMKTTKELWKSVNELQSSMSTLLSEREQIPATKLSEMDGAIATLGNQILSVHRGVTATLERMGQELMAVKQGLNLIATALDSSGLVPPETLSGEAPIQQSQAQVEVEARQTD